MLEKIWYKERLEIEIVHYIDDFTIGMKIDNFKEIEIEYVFSDTIFKKKELSNDKYSHLVEFYTKEYFELDDDYVFILKENNEYIIYGLDFGLYKNNIKNNKLRNTYKYVYSSDEGTEELNRPMKLKIINN